MRDARTVAVGLDVHKSSVRLAAVCRGEVLREVTLPYGHERVERELRGWPGARVVYEAGPTGFGLYSFGLLLCAICGSDGATPARLLVVQAGSAATRVGAEARAHPCG